MLQFAEMANRWGDATCSMNVCLPIVYGFAKVEDDINVRAGVNIGGWLLLEPWITPSLFRQFQDLVRGGALCGLCIVL